MMEEDIPKAKIQVPSENPNSEINFFGATNFRNQNRKFGIKLDDRRRHVYVVGKTGMGKTTLLENMVLNDIYAGHGVGYVDPHGDTAEKILDYIPANRINDVVYFNPSDIDFPIGFNILEVVKPEHKHLVSSGLMSVFKKIWPDVWSPRMEYILNNTILALLDTPGTTLLGINRMLSDDDYRDRIVKNAKDPVVKAFWEVEFASYSERFATEAVAAIQNKIGQFLSASVIRNIVAQLKSRIDIREIMDNRKILIMNLSKGRIGEDNSRLLGGMLVNRLQLAAMERVDIPEKERKDFFLFVDEFQNYATESFSNILSEARKYRLDLTMAHQYMEQLDEHVLAAVIGNVGTLITFRVGSTDAEILAKEYAPTFVEEDLLNLPKFQIYLKLMIDGVASKPFSALTLPPIAASTGSAERVIKVSRERYAVPREKIEDKIMRWSGMGPHEEGDGDDDAVDFQKALPPKPSGGSGAGGGQKPKNNPSQGNRNQQKGGGGGGGGQNKGGGGGGQHRSGGGSGGGGQNKGGQKNFGSDKKERRDKQHNEPRRHDEQKQQYHDAPRDQHREERKPIPPAGKEENVLIVDPNQKGISLSEILKPEVQVIPEENRIEKTEKTEPIIPSVPRKEEIVNVVDIKSEEQQNLPPKGNQPTKIEPGRVIKLD